MLLDITYFAITIMLSTAGSYDRVKYLQCLSNKRVVFIGDSVTRYQYLNLVYFLHTGRSISPFPHSETEMDIHGWRNFYTITSLRFGGNEICDCYRSSGDFRNFRENRHYYDNYYNLTVHMFSYFSKVPLRLNRIPNNIDFEAKESFVESFSNIKVLYTYDSIIEFMKDHIKSMRPDYLIFNQGFWSDKLDVITTKRFTAFTSTLADSSASPIWKTTTAYCFSHESTDKPDFIARLKSKNIRIFDAFELTRNCSLGDYMDQIHFQPHVYKMLNRELLQFLFPEHNPAPPVCSKFLSSTEAALSSPNYGLFRQLVDEIKRDNHDLKYVVVCLDQHSHLPHGHVNVHFQPWLVHSVDDEYSGQDIERLDGKYDIVVTSSIATDTRIARQRSYGIDSSAVYVPSLPQEYLPVHSRQSYEDHATSATIIASFYQGPIPDRLQAVLHQMGTMGMFVTSYDILNISSVDEFHSILDRTKILMHIHSGNSSNTLQDSILLPALLRNALIISEASLSQYIIPYHQLITWCKLDDIAVVVRQTMANYITKYAEVHGPDSLKHQIFAKLRVDAKITIETALRVALDRKMFGL